MQNTALMRGRACAKENQAAPLVANHGVLAIKAVVTRVVVAAALAAHHAAAHAIK